MESVASVTKKRKTDHKDKEPATTSEPTTNLGPQPRIMDIVISDKGKDKSGADEDPNKQKKPAETMPILTGHNVATIPPGIVKQLASSLITGHVRPASERIMKARFYELNLKNLRATMSSLLTEVLLRRYCESGKISTSQAETETAQIVPLTVNACMMALYAKLRTVHKQYGKYSGRYTTPASYNKDIELPLPFADAISDIGVFESTCANKCAIYVPVFPEGTKYEGRSVEEWYSYQYESCIQIFKDLSIPCRNVDSRLKTGSAWWTYKTSIYDNRFKGIMTVPPPHYSDNSATVASMFLGVDMTTNAILPLITFKDDDEDYGEKFRLVIPGVQIRAFEALCALPDEDWTLSSNID